MSGCTFRVERKMFSKAVDMDHWWVVGVGPDNCSSVSYGEGGS